MDSYKIKIEVQYDKNESISLFSDYLMELSDTCTSFFFLFNYEVNITELNKLLSLNATNLLDKKHEIQKLEAGNRDIYKEYISFRCYRGKVIPSIERRRKVEYMLLFKE